MNIYQMYQANSYKLGFYVRKSDWPSGQKAQVLAIEGVKEGQSIDGPPPYLQMGCYTQKVTKRKANKWDLEK